MAEWPLCAYIRYVKFYLFYISPIIIETHFFSAGRKEEPRGYNYWLLYRLPELPDPSNQPGNQLISSVIHTIYPVSFV